VRKGQKMTKESRAKMSAAKLGRKTRPLTEEAKQKISVANSGREWSEDAKQKLRDMRHPYSKEEKLKMRLARIKPVSEMSRQSLHRRVEQLRGKPMFCEKCETENEKTTYVWASPNHTREEYEDADSYIRMCLPCHGTFDNETGAYLVEARKEIERLKAIIAEAGLV